MTLSKSANKLYIHDVCVRDGFQMETLFVPTDRKVDLINRLGSTGITKIEVTSFSSPKAIPALADAEAVLSGIDRVSGVEYTALVPNVRGCERALNCILDELNVVMSASETHNRANLRMTREQSLAEFARIAKLASGAIAVNASLSTAFGCPFDGQISDDALLEIIQKVVDLGISRVTLCDTTGMANPAQVRRLCEQVLSRFPAVVLTAHFHNTRGMGLANCIAAMDAGITRFDASLAGLGGCPFAPGASGNVSTEDLVHMFHAMGYDTGIDLAALIALAQEIPSLVGHEVPGQVMKAGPYDRAYPKPPWLSDDGQQTRLDGERSSFVAPDCKATEVTR